MTTSRGNIEIDENYRVIVDGKPVLRLSERMINKQNVRHNVYNIAIAHLDLMDKYQEMQDELAKGDDTDWDLMRRYDQECTDIEFRQQREWGFKIDKKWHRFWQRPGCECPKMDNGERWGTPYTIVSGNCRLHWNEEEFDE